jgi:hypothetical protein
MHEDGIGLLEVICLLSMPTIFALGVMKYTPLSQLGGHIG